MRTPHFDALSPDVIQIWRAELDRPEEEISQLLNLISDDERERAKRFHFPRDRGRFVIGRGVLRTILAAHCGVSPQDVRFEYSRFGKPSLVRLDNTGDIRFNLSHSGGQALYAFGLGQETGVDIEQIRPDYPGMEIAKRFFSPSESDALSKLDSSDQAEAFFTCWTRKEAYIKAKGEGLSLPLHQFDVTFAPGEPARLQTTRPDASEALRWSMVDLRPLKGFVAAVVAEGRDWHPASYSWRFE